MMSHLVKLARAAMVVIVAAGPASAQEPGEPQWQQHAFDDADGGRTNVLSFAIPETDAWLFNAECAAGDEGPSIPVMLALDFGARANAEAVEVRFRTGDYEATLAGTVAIVSEEYAGISVTVGVEDAFWSALRRGHALEYGIVGEDMRSLSLRGSNDPVRRFMDSCQDMFASADEPAAPAPEGPFTYECEDGGTFQATFDNSRSNSVATITLDDNSATLVEVPSASGTLYSNGVLEMHVKGEEALVKTPRETVVCARRE